MNLPANKKIILFDGICNLCERSVQQIIQADTQDQFRFASLDSEIGKEISQYIGLDRSKTDSIVLYEPGQAYFVRGQAVLQIAQYLGGWYSLFGGFKIMPTFILDGLYNWVAKNRYKWYGKKASCMVPTAELRDKFL